MSSLFRNCVGHLLTSSAVIAKRLQQMLCQRCFCSKDNMSSTSKPKSIWVTTRNRHFITLDGVLLKDIRSSSNIESLFIILKAKRSWLTATHIGAAITRLLQLQKRFDDDNVEIIRNYTRFHPEFHGLCILAENKVRDVDNSTLVNMLYSLLKFIEEPEHSLVTQIIMEVDRRLSSFTINQLAIFAACSQYALVPKSILLGRVTELFHQHIDERMDIRDVATLFRATAGICSAKFRKQIYKKMLALLTDETEVKASTNDLRKILHSISVVNDAPTLLRDECVSQLYARIDSLSIFDLSTIYYSLETTNCHEMRLTIVKRLEELLPIHSQPIDLVRSMRVLAPHASSQLKINLEELALAAMPTLPVYHLGNLCVSLRVMGFRVPSLLISSIAQKFQENTDDVQFHSLLKIVEFFHNTHIPQDAPIFKSLEKTLLSFLPSSISPARVIGVVYSLSLLPIQSLDPIVIDKLDRMLHQFNVVTINQVFQALQRISKMLEKSGNSSTAITNLLQKSNVLALSQISQVTSLIYLNSTIRHMLDEGSNNVLLSTVMSQFTTCLHRLTPQIAVECARNVLKTRFLQIPLLNAIADVASENIHGITPRQVLVMLSPYCVLNYQPDNSNKFFNICVQRFLPYMDHVPRTFLLDMAHMLSIVQIFPEQLHKQIFNLDFLIKLEEEVDATPRTRSRVYCQRLMQLNRAVVIECAHLQVPWFHEEYCQEILKTRQMSFPPVLRSIQNSLSEILGGPQFFRSFVQTPYHYEIDFECVLDCDGSPLPCADYGSVLNRSGQLTSTVLSDLMQWGTQAKHLPSGAQRIAIDFLFQSQFCHGSRHPIGVVTSKKRHLELMGYRYVQIPYYVWNSLSLSEHEDHNVYLQELIFEKNPKLIQTLQSYSSPTSGLEQEALVMKLLHMFDRIS